MIEDQEPIDELERRLLAAFGNLDLEDRERLLLVVTAMRAGVQINPADMLDKTPEELRLFAERLSQQLASLRAIH